MKGVGNEYGANVPAAISMAGIKELISQVEELQKRDAELERRISELEQEN